LITILTNSGSANLNSIKLMNMKFSSIICFVLAVALVSTGCKKNEIKYGEFENITSDQSLLKVNFVSGYASNPAVQFVINGERVSNLITSRTPYPGGGYNTGGGSTPDYLALTAGSKDFKISIPKKGTNTDSLVLYTTTFNLEAGKTYTAHITDTAANTKSLITADNLTKPDSGYAKLRFVNLMPNVPAIDLYYGTTKVASNIAYLSNSDYFTIQTPSTTLAWTTREAGTAATSPALATYTSASTTASQRIFTAFAMGYKGSTDAVRKPYISFLVNQ
jgi:hypothetical protein